MKRLFTTAFLALFTALFSHSEGINSIKDTNILSRNAAADPGKAVAYGSDWETVTGWASRKDSNTFNFHFSRRTPELTPAIVQTGAVLVFARNLWADVPAFVELGAPDKPIKMPFYFLPDFDKPDYSEMWSYAANENKIDLILQVKGVKGSWGPGKKVQFRFVVIPQEVLNQKGQSVQSVRKMSYNEVIQTFNIN